MPYHLIDDETGLCTVCQRLKIAAIKESSKYNRPKYNSRKESFTIISNKLRKHCNDPSLIRVVSNNYAEYANKDNNFYDMGDEHQNITITRRAKEKVDTSIKYSNQLNLKESPEYVIDASNPQNLKNLTISSPVYLFPRVNLKALDELTEPEQEEEEKVYFEKSKKKWIYVEEHKEDRKKLALLDRRHNAPLVMAKPPVNVDTTVLQLNK